MTAGGKPAGSSRIESVMKGCGVLEHWSSAGGGHGTSLNFYDRRTKTWSQAWIDEGGNALHLAGTFADGRMVLASEPRKTASGIDVQRITWSKNADGTVRQLWESSTDGGSTWTVALTGPTPRSRERHRIGFGPLGRTRLAHRGRVAPPRLQHAHVVAALERARVGAARQAHAAAHLRERLVLVLLQPALEALAQHAAGARGRARSSAETTCTASAPAMTALTTSSTPWTPPLAASEARTRPERIASQRSRSSSSEESDRRSARHDVQRLDVDVRLVEAVEQHQAVGAGAVERRGQVRQRRVERRQLHRDRDARSTRSAPRRCRAARRSTDAAALDRVGGDVVDVQLQRVGAGLLDQPGVVEPAFAGRRRSASAITGTRDRRLDPAELLQVPSGPSA